MGRVFNLQLFTFFRNAAHVSLRRGLSERSSSRYRLAPGLHELGLLVRRLDRLPPRAGPSQPEPGRHSASPGVRGPGSKQNQSTQTNKN